MFSWFKGRKLWEACSRNLFHGLFSLTRKFSLELIKIFSVKYFTLEKFGYYLRSVVLELCLTILIPQKKKNNLKKFLKKIKTRKCHIPHTLDSVLICFLGVPLSSVSGQLGNQATRVTSARQWQRLLWCLSQARCSQPHWAGNPILITCMFPNTSKTPPLLSGLWAYLKVP